MALRRTTYTDEEGRIRAVLLPEGELNINAHMGIPVGPPSLVTLGLPLDVEVRLNNELFYRGILTAQDATRRRPEIVAAIQSAFKVDAEKVVVLYAGRDYRNAKAPEIKPNTPVQHRRPRKPRK